MAALGGFARRLPEQYEYSTLSVEKARKKVHPGDG
jgi:hypothetical protein